jgi:hypothetical protein
MKNQKTRKKERNERKTHKKKKNSPNAALTGRPNIAPIRAEQGSVPLTGGA